MVSTCILSSQSKQLLARPYHHDGKSSWIWGVCCLQSFITISGKLTELCNRVSLSQEFFACKYQVDFLT